MKYKDSGVLDMKLILKRFYPAFFVLFFAASPLIAQEDSAHLVFKRKPALRSADRITEYTVKKFDSLIKIIIRELHIKNHHLRFIREEILPLNPGIKDINIIHPGQKIYLPKLEAINGEVPQTKLVPRLNFGILKHIIEKMGGSLNRTGEHIIPLGASGRVIIDCSRMPVLDFPDGTVIILDTGNHLPPDIQSLVLKTWKNYRILNVHPAWGTMELLSACIKTLAPAYSMKDIKSGLLVKKVRLHLPSSFLISGEKNLLIHRATNLEESFPSFIGEILKDLDVEVIEVLGDKEVLSGDKEVKKSSTPLPHLTASTAEEFLQEILKFFGYPPEQTKEITIFSAREDGFDLRAPVQCGVEKDGRKIYFTFSPFPQHFQKLLSERNILVVSLPVADRKQMIEKVARALNISFLDGPKAFTIPHILPGSQITVSFSTIKFPYTPAGSVHFVDFSLDNRIYTFLHDKLGHRFVKY